MKTAAAPNHCRTCGQRVTRLRCVAPDCRAGVTYLCHCGWRAELARDQRQHGGVCAACRGARLEHLRERNR